MSYSDIIHLSRPISTKHPPMPLEKRAAQFSPFAALSGYDDLARETSRLTSKRIHMDDDAIETLNLKLQQLLRISHHPPVTVEYFQPDPCKEGGTYLTARGTIKRIDTIFHKLILTDNTELALDNISNIHSSLLPDETFY